MEDRTFEVGAEEFEEWDMAFIRVRLIEDHTLTLGKHNYSSFDEEKKQSYRAKMIDIIRDERRTV